MSSCDKDDNTDLFRELNVSRRAEIAWGILYVLYWPAVVRVISKKFKTIDEQTAEDIATGALTKLWIKRAEVARLDIPKDWLFRVAMNDANDYVKTKLRRKQRPIVEADLDIAEYDEIGDKLDTKEAWELIQQYMARLPPETRKAFEMKYGDGRTNQEIAKELDKSPQTIGNQVQRGLKKLRRWMNAKGPPSKQE